MLSLYHYRARIYEATLGKLFSKDPIGYPSRLSGLYLVDIYSSAVDATSNQKVLPEDGPSVPADAICFFLAYAGKKTMHQRCKTCIVSYRNV